MFRTFLKENEWEIIQPLLPSHAGKPQLFWLVL
jgi:hypothetical protein